MTHETPSGLFAGSSVGPESGRPSLIPLAGVRIDARLDGLSLAVTVTQRYRNTEEIPIEAVYVFPLEEGAAVSGFAARIGDRVVRGRVEERDKAFEIYDDAMAAGHGAFLLDQERPNVFTASVGNLRPGEEVEIEITYVALARCEGDAVRLTIPTTVSPRYVPEGLPEVGQPDSERLNPERRLRVPYGLTLRVEVDAGGPLRGVDSPSHAVRTRLREGGATVELSRGEAALDRDFVLLVEPREPHRPSARAAREADGTAVLMLSFHPDLDGEAAGPGEVLFLLDCSGSMAGDSIDQARRALALALRALAEGDTFNVVRFGSRFESLWPRPRPYGDATLEEATRYLAGAGADLNGTEILAPLTHLLEQEADPGRPRQILLLTDGQVANEHEIIRLAERHGDTARIFTFGIGAGASEHLVRELARVSRGAAELIFPGERIEPKVLRMASRVRTPALADVRVDWGGLEVEQAPAQTPPVFAGDALTVFARVLSGAATAVTLRAGDRGWEVPIDLAAAAEGGPVPVLWARHVIRDLERGITPRRGHRQRLPAAEERRHHRLVDLGRRYGLTSSATSWVAVEERPEGERVDGDAELRKIPIALTVGWGGHGHLLGGAAAPPALHAAAGILHADPREDRMTASRPLTTAMPAAGSSFLDAASGALSGFFTRRRVKRAGPASEIAEGPAKIEVGDRLYGVLMSQNADGSFHRSRALEEWLDAALPALEAAVAEHGEAVAVTAVVLALLERDAAARREEWRAAAAKARRWLARQGSDFDAAALVGGWAG